MTKTFRLALFASAGAATIATAAYATDATTDTTKKSKRPIELTIEEPLGGSPRQRDLGDKIQIKKGEKRRKPLLYEDGWSLSFRMAAPASEEVVRIRERLSGSFDYDVLVLDNPDGCLDFAATFPTEFAPFSIPFPSLETCPGVNDDVTVNFVTDEFDAPGVTDTESNCLSNIQAALADDPFGAVPFTQSNKAYVRSRLNDPTSFPRPLGVFTGGELGAFDGAADCYGYGTDEDAPSLVVMANVAGARVFDENLNYDNTRLRNLAGLTSNVSFELLDENNASAIVAHMPVRPGLLRPLTFIDLSRDIFQFADVTGDAYVIKRKIEDGPIETIATLPGDSDGLLLLETLRDAVPNNYKVEIRAVVVKGIAPAFIEDMNADGRFTARDLRLAGYTLLSNEAVKRVRLTNFDVDAVEADLFECPAGPIYIDLDGDGLSGFCEDGDGTSRSRTTVPR